LKDNPLKNKEKQTVKTTKKTTLKKLPKSVDINFIKMVARDHDKSISDDEAIRAHKAVIKYVKSAKSAEYYYALKEYFIN